MVSNLESEDASIHLAFLKQALELSRSSPSRPTNFRVGAIIVAFPRDNNPVDSSPIPPSILSTGYTLELPGNTHAEQCALSKLAEVHGVSESDLSSALPSSLNAILYTSLEPCGKRLSGNLPCVQRIINTRRSQDEGVSGIQRVIFGAKEPGTFVQDSQSCRSLDEAGVPWMYIPELERDILAVAMAGHDQPPDEEISLGQGTDAGKQPRERVPSQWTNINDIPAAERGRQAAQPRNPKKRMMEVEVPSKMTD